MENILHSLSFVFTVSRAAYVSVCVYTSVSIVHIKWYCHHQFSYKYFKDKTEKKIESATNFEYRDECENRWLSRKNEPISNRQ